MTTILILNLSEVNHEIVIYLIAPASLMNSIMMAVLTSLPIDDWADGADTPLADGLLLRPVWAEWN